jgi:flagellar hook protein FlgE
MSFNIGLSALNAAQQEINVTGNNIANAGTNGFKAAKTVFGDVYAASVLGGGGTQQGSGVSLQEIKQSFVQGNISFTDNTLDLAVNGAGFFILKGESGVSYSRAGAFGTDKDGFVVNSDRERLQGFAPSESGQATGGGPLSDLRVTTGEIQPRPTTFVESTINLDAAAQPSTIIGSNYVSKNGDATPVRTINAGDPVNNGYEATAIKVIGADMQSQVLEVPENASANAVAQIFAGATGVSAIGKTVGYVSDIAAGAGNPNFSVNGISYTLDEAAHTAGTSSYQQQLAAQINAGFGNLSAKVVDNGGTETVEITHNTGADLVITGGVGGNGSLNLITSKRQPDTETFTPLGAATNIDLSGGDSLTIGGIVLFELEENVELKLPVDADMDDGETAPTGTELSIFGDISGEEGLLGVSFETNQFDSKNPDTYYRSTAITIYDTVGTPHSLAMYFVKERPDDTGETNLWSVYFEVDGRNIGYDPNSEDGVPVPARYDLRFDDTGRYDPNQTPIDITNWFPVDSSGRRIGAGPVPGDPNVGERLNNSNFRIDLTEMTAFGGDFSVQNSDQDGFAKGQLTGLEVNTRGLVSARFSNGQSRVLGEVALANFANASGLANLGGSKFAETSESGAASVSGAGTAGLGAIQSGALEDSNVDLPTELVQLIISQRNYQAAAQIISATDDSTQTIINL